ncbi:MAG: AAA family ATPase [Gammaproteobacteria bacterium]|nr:AAA family ATPase [Gammaproteobacteria bacterium]
MIDKIFLSLFTPSRSRPEDLEVIFVQRHGILADAVERVKESATTGNKHHLLFVGPRGTGKTHLVTLLVHRLDKDVSLDNKLRIAWLNEDETSTTLLEFLQRIYLALNKRHEDEFDKKSFDAIFDFQPEEAKRYIIQLLLEKLQEYTLLVIVENIDTLFEELGKSGQQDLRAFIQENPVFSFVSTAQKIIDDISKRKNTFFGFFQTEQLKNLSIHEATELLRKISIINNQQDLASFLQSDTGRSRILALYHISGGNHRIYIALSKFITHDSINMLVDLFAKMIDKMTPYYQERIRWLAPQQRKIIEYLCACERPVPVKAIAKRLFATHQSISSQLNDLRKKGYVQANQRGRESLYEIAEPLMRICVEVKENQTNDPLRILIDFLRIWYDGRELSMRLQECNSMSVEQAYLKSAIDKNLMHGNLRVQLMAAEFRAEISDNQNSQSDVRITVDVVVEALLYRGIAHGKLGESEKEIADYSVVIDLADASADAVAEALISRGIAYGKLGELNKTITDCSAVIDLTDVPVEAVAKAFINRGITYGKLGESEKEIADYSAVIDLADTFVETVAEAFINRGIAYGKLGELNKTITDCSVVIDLTDVSVEIVARALFYRGIAYGKLKKLKKAITDCSVVIDLKGASMDIVARALFYRGITYRKLGKSEREITDYSGVINLKDAAPVEIVARALLYRGNRKLGESEATITDYSAIIDLKDAPVETVAEARLYRGTTYGKLGESEKAITDYSAVIDLKDAAPVEIVARALLYRGITCGKLGESEKIITDCSAVIDLKDAPVDAVAGACLYRGTTYGKLGESEKAITDFSTVIDLTDAPVDIIAEVFFYRGITYRIQNNLEKSEKDFKAVISLENTLIPIRVDAYLFLAEIYMSDGRWDFAILMIDNGLREERNSHDTYSGDSTNIIDVFFKSTFIPRIRQERIRMLVKVYEDNNAIAQLSGALIKHLGVLFTSGEDLPASDNLELWASAWEDTFNNIDESKLPLRIFRTGIDFLKSNGKDHSILLDLNQEEVKILKQAMAL